MTKCLKCARCKKYKYFNSNKKTCEDCRIYFYKTNHGLHGKVTKSKSMDITNFFK